jgi:hypothetical protein
LNLNSADNLNITTRILEKYFGFFMSLRIYIFQKFILNYKIILNFKLQKKFKPVFPLFCLLCLSDL